MKGKKIFSLLIAAAVVFSNVTFMPFSAQDTYAATTTEGDFSLTGDTLTIKNDSDVIEMQVCSSDILKVNYKPNGEEDPETEVIDPDKKWDTGNIISSDLKSDPAVIKTDNMTVKISKADLSVSVYNSSGKLILKQDSIKEAKSVSFTHNSGENFYGISGYGCGTSANDGSLRNNNSYDVTCASQGWAGGPFTWSTGGYGLLVDSDGGKITTGDTTLSYSGISKKNAEYFVIVGKPTEIMKGLSEVSGSAPMYPKWAMGFTNTQWGWPGSGTVEDQVKDVIETYRSKNIPIDNFCFDFDWKYWGVPEMDNGEFTWNGDNFPSAASGNLKKWQDDNGIHFTGIIKPRIFTGKEAGKDTAQFAEATKNGYVSKTAQKGSDYCAGKDYVSIDYSTQEARDWWWSKYEKSFDLGLQGFWNDEIDHDNGYGNFGNMNAQRAIYEGQRKYTNDGTRVWSINRNFYLGAQRYSYGVWTGDIGTGFASMKGQAGKMIASANLGETKWGMDTGGFNGGDPSPENYARWIEFSAFTPIFRVHGQDCRSAEQAPSTGRSATPRYPWKFGDTAEAAAKNAMQLRYRLIPYIYKYEYDASNGGTGLIKPLMMMYPNDSNVSSEVYSWMFGDYMLVSPVLDEGQTSKDIYLPAGKWTDYSNGKEYDGGQTITIDTDATTWKDIPIFIKQGAIIPTQQDVNYVGEKKITNINLDVFPDAKSSSFEYYDDDGQSYDYEDGSNFYKQNLTVSPNSAGDGITFKTAKKEGTYDSDLETYTVKLHVKNATSVTCNGKELKKSGTLAGIDTASAGTYSVGTDDLGEAVYIKIDAGDVTTLDVKCDVPTAAQQSATVYAKTSAGSADLEYSTDGGNTWTNKESMTQSSNAGYLQADIKYIPEGGNNVKVRCNLGDNNYFPSKDGVELDSEETIFTIGKDGKLKTGAPASSTATLYIASTERPAIQVKDDSGWSDAMLLDSYGTEKGQYSKSISYDADNPNVTIRYSTDNGKTWLPSDDGTTITTGDFMNDSTGKIVAGRPDWDNSVILYYKGSATNIHWRPLGGGEDTWTKSPGDVMEPAEIDGYLKITLNVGTATGAEVCFNKNGTAWDNNGGKNYTINMGTNTFDNGKISAGGPNGGGSGEVVTEGLTITSSIKGGTYNKEQTLKLTASDKNATIYYTLDGSDPTESSSEYSEPIKISKTTTVKSIAVDKKGNKSAINIQKYVIDASIIDPPVEELTKVTLEASSKNVNVGDKIKLTATADTDDESVKYEFGYYDEDSEWNILSEYSSDNTYSWIVKDEGEYNVIVKAKSDDVDEIESESIKITVKKSGGQTYPKLSKVTIASNTQTVIKGQDVKLTATVNTEDPTVEYSFGYYDDNNKWHQLRDYTSSPSYIWTTTDAGTFEIVAKAKSEEVSAIDSSSISVLVNEPGGENPDPEESLKSVKIVSNKDSIKVGDVVTFTATTNYDDGSVQYQFGYYDKNNNWKVLKQYSSSNVFEWTSGEVGTFDVYVRVKSDNVTKPIKSEESVKVTVANKESEDPKPDTFDNNSLGLIMVLLLLSGATVTSLRKNKRI